MTELNAQQEEALDSIILNATESVEEAADTYGDDLFVRDGDKVGLNLVVLGAFAAGMAESGSLVAVTGGNADMLYVNATYILSAFVARGLNG